MATVQLGDAQRNCNAAPANQRPRPRQQRTHTDAVGLTGRCAETEADRLVLRVVTDRPTSEVGVVHFAGVDRGHVEGNRRTPLEVDP
jgi:hypothetical protein